MDKRTVLLLVRHGEAVGNPQHRFIGQTEAPLTTLGTAQASTVAGRLASMGVERIIASDLARTMQTAQPLASLLDLPIDQDPRLREIENGDWTGLLPEEIAERWPELWNAYRQGEDVQRPNGERWADVGTRVREAITDLRSSGETVAVFSHAGPILHIASHAIGLGDVRHLFKGSLGVPGNASISRIDYPGPVLSSFNDTGHFDPRGAADPRLPFLDNAP